MLKRHGIVCSCALASKMDFRPHVRFRSGLCNYLRNAYSTAAEESARRQSPVAQCHGKAPRHRGRVVGWQQ